MALLLPCCLALPPILKLQRVPPWSDTFRESRQPRQLPRITKEKMSSLLGRKRSKRVVVFLCTGNTCRGPMAQGYMKHAMAERGVKTVEVKTAGVMTIPGLIPTPEACQVMANAGIDIKGHRSSPLTPELIRKADVILGMTPFHVQFALRMSDDAKDKTYLLKEYAESDLKNYQISDPMGATLEVYKRVYREMKLAIDKMLETKELLNGVEEEDPRRARRKAIAEAEASPKRVAAKAAAAAAKAAPVPAKAPVKPAAKAAPAKAAPAKAPPAKAPAKAAPAKPAAKPTAKPAAPAAKKPAAKGK